MKLIISILLLFVSSLVFSQKPIIYDKVYKSIVQSPQYLNIDLIVYNPYFNIGLNQTMIVENIFQDPCIDIRIDSLEATNILGILEKNSLLDSIFIKVSNGRLTNIQTVKECDTNQVLLYVCLFSSATIYYLPIKDYEKSIRILKDISKVIGKRQCFRELRTIIKTKHNNG